MLDVVHIDPIQFQIRHLVEFSRMRKWIQFKIDIISIFTGKKESYLERSVALVCERVT